MSLVHEPWGITKEMREWQPQQQWPILIENIENMVSTINVLSMEDTHKWYI